jgi:hypothetical protein
VSVESQRRRRWHRVVGCGSSMLIEPGGGLLLFANRRAVKTIHRRRAPTSTRTRTSSPQVTRHNHTDNSVRAQLTGFDVDAHPSSTSQGCRLRTATFHTHHFASLSTELHDIYASFPSLSAAHHQQSSVNNNGQKAKRQSNVCMRCDWLNYRTRQARSHVVSYGPCVEQNPTPKNPCVPLLVSWEKPNSFPRP